MPKRDGTRPGLCGNVMEQWREGKRPAIQKPQLVKIGQPA